MSVRPSGPIFVQKSFYGNLGLELDDVFVVRLKPDVIVMESILKTGWTRKTYEGRSVNTTSLLRHVFATGRLYEFFREEAPIIMISPGDWMAAMTRMRRPSDRALWGVLGILVRAHSELQDIFYRDYPDEPIQSREHIRDAYLMGRWYIAHEKEYTRR